MSTKIINNWNEKWMFHNNNNNIYYYTIYDIRIRLIKAEVKCVQMNYDKLLFL